MVILLALLAHGSELIAPAAETPESLLKLPIMTREAL
jgi:hypothetical protein